MFCDDRAAFANIAEGDERFRAIFDATPNEAALRAIANDASVETRVRALAFNRLREAGKAVPKGRLLGVVIEVPLEQGLDTLAAYDDGRIRYINQTGKLAVVEFDAPQLRPLREALLHAGQAVVEKIGPWTKSRLPPPQAGHVRMTFVATDGLHFGEGGMHELMKDSLAQPVMAAAGQLLNETVDFVLAKQDS